MERCELAPWFQEDFWETVRGGVCLESRATASVASHLILICWEESKQDAEGGEAEPVGAIGVRESSLERPA